MCWLAQNFFYAKPGEYEMERKRTNETAVYKMREIAATSNVCMVITTGAEGSRNNRPIAAARIDDEGSCWFFASKSSGKLKDISHNNKLQVVFANPDRDDYLEIHGTASVICDEAEIADKWNPLADGWFPGGMQDPEVCLVKIEVTNVFYWDAEEEGIQRLSISMNVMADQKLAA